MTNLFDALEFCLQEIESGVDLETTLARFPEYASELRPILETSIKAREMAGTAPSPDVVRRSRARVMQHAAGMRESKIVPTRRVIPLFQRLAISFTLAAVFLLSGNGLLSASASALPGERLYPVKRGWETVRLFFIFDTEARELLKNEFENERLHEANELLTEGRHEIIDFAGVFMQVNDISYVSGLQVILPVGMPLPANGDAVVVSGRTNAQGFVDVISIQLLPAGSIVPMGNPIEMELESTSEEQSPQPAGSSSGSENEAVESNPEESEVQGTLQSISTTTLVINGMTVYLDNTKIDGQLCIGMEVDAKGYFSADGKFIVLEVQGKGECSTGSSSNGSSSSNSNGGTLNDNSADNNSNSGSSDNLDSNDNSVDDHGGDSGSSGSGGGGSED